VIYFKEAKSEETGMLGEITTEQERHDTKSERKGTKVGRKREPKNAAKTKRNKRAAT